MNIEPKKPGKKIEIGTIVTLVLAAFAEFYDMLPPDWSPKVGTAGLALWALVRFYRRKTGGKEIAAEMDELREELHEVRQIANAKKALPVRPESEN